MYTFAYATFPLIDCLFVLTTAEKSICVGVQMKVGNDYPSESPPEWISMCYLVRDKAKSSGYSKKKGWYYMSALEVKGLLGYSFQSLYPDIGST
jgi:hypothetical protein